MKKFLAVTLTCALLLAGLLACAGQTEEKQADLSAFAKGLTEQYEFAGYLTEMTPEYPYYEEDMNRCLPGLLEMDLEQMVIYMTMITLNNGEFPMVQAKSSEDAAKAAEIFQARIDYMAGDGETPGGAFYPGPTELWRNSSRVVTQGNYVMMVTGEDCDRIVEDFKALFA